MILLDCFPYVVSISLILFVYICICIYFPSTSMFILQTYLNGNLQKDTDLPTM